MQPDILEHFVSVKKAAAFFWNAEVLE